MMNKWVKDTCKMRTVLRLVKKRSFFKLFACLQENVWPFVFQFC